MTSSRKKLVVSEQAEHPAQVLLDASRVYAQAALVAPDLTDRFMFDEAAEHYRRAAYRIYPLRINGAATDQTTSNVGGTADLRSDWVPKVVLDTELRVQETLDTAIAALSGIDPLIERMAGLYCTSHHWRDDILASRTPNVPPPPARTSGVI